MADAVELATAYVALVPSAKGIAGKLTEELGGPSEKAGKDAGEKAGGGLLSSFGGKVAGIGALVAGAGVIGLAGAALKIGASFDDAFDTIRTVTGKTGDQLEGLQGSFKNVFASVPTSAADAGTAIAGLNQKLGLTGKPLEDIAAQVLDLSRITETDLSANIEAVTGVFNNWGISAEDQGTKLDELFRASQATGVSVTDLSNTMGQSGSVLRQAGLSFEDSAALLGTLSKNGVDAASVMPSLSKAVATAAKEGKNATDVLKGTFEAIRNAPDDTSAAAAAMDTFGAKAGPQLAGLVRQGKLSFEELSASIAAGGDTIKSAAEDTADFPEKLKTFANQAMVAFEPLASAVFSLAGNLLEKLGPALQFVAGWLSDHLVPAVTSLVSGLGSALGPVIKEIIGGFRALGEAFKAGDGDITSSGFAGVMERIGNAARTVFDWFKDNWPKIKDFIASAFAGAVDFITPLIPPLLSVAGAVFDLVKAVAVLIKDHWPQIKSGFETIIPIVLKVAEILRGGISEAMNVLGGVIKFVSNNLNDFLPGLAILIGAFAAYKAVTLTVSAVTKAYTAVQAALNVVMSANPIGLAVIALAALVTGFVLAYNHIKPFHDAVDAVAGAIKAFVTGAIDFFINHWQLLLAILTGPIGAAVILIIGHFDTIKNAITGVVTWVGTKIGEFIAFFVALPGNIISAIGDFASLLLGKGIDLIQGLINGYLSLVGTVTSFFTGLAGQVLGWIGDAASWLFSKGVDAIQGFINGYLNIIGQVTGFFTGLGGQIIGLLAGAVGWLVGIGEDVIRGLKNGIVGFFEREVRGFINIGQWIKDSVGDLSNLLVSVGEDIVRGLRDGIANSWHWVTDKVESLTKLIPGPIRSLLGANSPSKVFMAIGEDVSAGMQIGIESGFTGVFSSLESAATQMTKTKFAVNPSVGSILPDVASLNATGSGVLASGATFNNTFNQVGSDPSAITREISWLALTQR